jgi:hypothetical protein
MKVLSLIRCSEKYREAQPPAAMMKGECEVRPSEFLASEAGGAE